MNYISHLNAFLFYQQKEQRLNAYHVSLYMALFHCWNQERFKATFPVKRVRLMQLSHIGSRSTYTKCLHQLHTCGYIVYHPSLHPGHQPSVSMVPLQPPPKAPAKNEPPPGPDMDLLQLKIGAQACPNVGHLNKQYINGIKCGQTTPAPIPNREEVFSYFNAMAYPQKEAERFFNHYRANGWKQGGKTPIANWQAAAEKWMSYALEIKLKQQQHANNNTQLHVQQHKNYENPL
ncbi:MAG TPA: hypothetical protein VFS25_05275 [Chitinophaga sp.]|uniref:hypothetical protein n=1 Tax=Chitinophaga sp. TaxID=1869181 RepID=UPI002DB97115|nr:hypothetical protein [Chitinophaga sp.]HEU4552219.1 hypothetical protein [Chitinophaga sp.]